MVLAKYGVDSEREFGADVLVNTNCVTPTKHLPSMTSMFEYPLLEWQIETERGE